MSVEVRNFQTYFLVFAICWTDIGHNGTHWIIQGVAAARRSAANIAQKWKKLSGSSAGTGADNRSSVQERSEPETPQQPFHEMELFEREDVYYGKTYLL